MHYLPHDHEHPQTHDEPAGPGAFADRQTPLARDYRTRAFTVGIGGPVGSGKTALLLALCERLRDQYSLAVVTNDIFTKEDGEFLVRHKALPAERVTAVAAGGRGPERDGARLPAYARRRPVRIRAGEERCGCRRNREPSARDLEHGHPPVMEADSE